MSLELNGIITIDKLARYNQKIAEKYALITELEEALKQINLADYYTKKQVDEIIGTIEGTEEQVIVTAMTSEDILAAIGMAGESVPVNPSGQILTEMSAEDVLTVVEAITGNGIPVNPSGQMLNKMSAEDVNNIIKG